MARTNPVPISEHSLSGERLALLAIFAHPEDEAFGPAGTLAKYANEGVQVSLVVATREKNRGSDGAMLNADECFDREQSCACRTSGVRRACLLGYPTGELDKVELVFIEEQIVRLMREIHPQVVITCSEHSIAEDRDHQIINRATTAAFRDAGDSAKFAHHFYEGLAAYSPQKLYYCVLPESFVSRSGIQGLATVPDDRVTTVLDVSSHREAMDKAMFCHRSDSVDFIQGLEKNPQVHWNAEYYELAESTLNKKPRHEKDLFAGLR